MSDLRTAVEGLRRFRTRDGATWPWVNQYEVLALIPQGSVLVTEETLATALVEVEESKLSAHPECLTGECDHEECPDWAALGCGDAAAILARIRGSDD